MQEEKTEADDIPSQNELFLIASAIKNPKERALFIFEYLTGGRIGEIVRRTKKKQLQEVMIKEKPFLIIMKFFTEKNRKIKKRSLPIPIHKELRFYELAKEHLNTKNDDDIIFDFSRVSAWTYITRILKTFKKMSTENKFLNANHFMRHCRATHLVTIYDFNEQELIRYMGWSDGRPAKSYMHLKYTDLAEKMI